MALINNKGGVGKTTTAVNLAAALARDAQRTLLIDLDAQGSASLHLGVREGPSDAYRALLHRAYETTPTSVPGLELLPGSPRLARFDLEVAAREDHQELLAGLLEQYRQDFEHLVIDCPPALSLLTTSALRASQRYLVPVTPHYLALEGLVNLLRFAEDHRGRCLGILLTMVDYRTRVTREIVDLLRERFADDVLQTEIRMNVRLAEASSFGQSIFDYDRRSQGARLYAQLKEEVLARCLALAV